MTYDNAPLAIADVEASMDRHAGHLVCEVGEDSEQLLILGHLDDEQAREVAVAYASAAWSYDDGDVTENPGVSRGWYAFTPHQDDCAVNVCDPCIAGKHDACSQPTDCECAGTGEDHGGRWCSCDEYQWWAEPWSARWAAPFPHVGHPDFHAVTWVTL